MKITIYFRDEDDECGQVTVDASEALDKIRALLNDGGYLITGISDHHD